MDVEFELTNRTFQILRNETTTRVSKFRLAKQILNFSTAFKAALERICDFFEAENQEDAPKHVK